MKTQRHIRRSRRGQVLIILAGTLFLGASATIAGTYLTGMEVKEIDKAVKQTVDDKDRAHAARSVIKDWEKLGHSFEKRTNKRRKVLLKLLKSHDSNPTEIEALFAEQDADTNAVTGKVLDHRFALCNELTDAEWSAIFGPE